MPQTLTDSLLNNLDSLLKTLTHTASGTGRAYPAQDIPPCQLSDSQRKHIAGLMRVNHAGEVCAQGLYHGQSLTATLEKVRVAMQQAADEEGDHLNWCHQRLKELESHTSLLNPLWYGASFSLGAIAGLIGDKVSLGFVAEIEKQVHSHLQRHIDQLPEQDGRTRTILETMQRDEKQHQEQAQAAGGIDFPQPMQQLMAASSKLMTGTSYYI